MATKKQDAATPETPPRPRGRPPTTGSRSWPYIRARVAPTVLEALQRAADDAGRTVSAHVAHVLTESAERKSSAK